MLKTILSSIALVVLFLLFYLALCVLIAGVATIINHFRKKPGKDVFWRTFLDMFLNILDPLNWF